MLCQLTPADAADWQVTPRVTVSETYSDNIRLAPAGQADSDFVTNLSPGLNIHGEGRRGTVDLFYNLQGLIYAEGTGANRINNQVQAVANAELYDQLAFMDFRSTYRQLNILNAGRQAGDTISATNNVSNVYTVQVSPYLRSRFAGNAEGELRFTYELVGNDVDTGSQAYDGLLALNSGPDFQHLPWSIFANYRYEDRQNASSVTFRRVLGEGRYRITRKYALLAGIGYEDNDLGPFAAQDTSGLNWLAGLSLTPNPRTLIEGGVEERFFGLAPFANVRIQSRRTVWTLSYVENVTTVNQSIGNLEFIPLQDPFGNPILDPDAALADRIPIDTPTLVNEVLRTKNFNTALTVQGRRTNVTIRLYAQDRDFEVQPDEQVFGATGLVSRQLSRRLNASLSGGWQGNDNASSANRNRWNIGFALSRTFSPTFTGALSFRHVTQTSDNPIDEFDENRASIVLNKTF